MRVRRTYAEHVLRDLPELAAIGLYQGLGMSVDQDNDSKPFRERNSAHEPYWLQERCSMSATKICG